MRKAIFIFCLFNLFLRIASAQVPKGQIDSTQIPVLKSHYQDEFTFDVSTDPGKWATQKKGLNVSFGSSDALYFRTEVPGIESPQLSFSQTGWKGERVNAQILVWSPDTLEQVRFKVNDLTDAKGNTIGKENIKLDMVRYVLSNYPYGARDLTCGVAPTKYGYLMPDRFETFDRFDVPGKTVRPVWLTLNLPQTAEAGVYKGTVEVIGKGQQPTTLHLKVQVQNQVLPKPHDWKHRLDLWQNPWAVAWYYKVEPWSEEHKTLLKKHLKPYADAGGKYITTYAVHSPWSDNSYMIEGGMIDWVKRTNGSWKFDYNIFDQYVQLCMDAGIDEAITIYTPVPWGNRFRYLDEKTGDYVYEEWAPESDKFKAFWNVFLDDLKSHLEKKGWMQKTYLGINENPLNYTLAAAKLIKAHSSKWRITYAGDWHPELDSLLDDYSFLHGKESDLNKVKERSARGFTTTYYVCCNPSVPNNFVFSPPVEGRWISWYTAAYGYDGFLRWAYEAWPQDPVRDARHTLWPAGDAFLVYPGGNSCIRYEKLREGIVDFEKIRILRELAAKSNDKKGRKSMQELEAHLKTLTGERDFKEEKLANDIVKGKKLIEDISDRFVPSKMLSELN
jgi:hypothetical protein